MLNTRTVQIGILVFLIISLIFTTASAFAYWQEVTVTNTINVASIRDGVDIEVTDITDSTQSVNLVPEGHVMFVGDVDRVELTYNVSVTRELLNEVNLHVWAHSVTIGEEDTYGHLVDITINNDANETIVDIFNSIVTITVTVRLIEPIDEAEALALGYNLDRVNVDDSRLAYETIAGEDIVFTLRFELRNKPTNSNNEN